LDSVPHSAPHRDHELERLPLNSSRCGEECGTVSNFQAQAPAPSRSPNISLPREVLAA